MTMKILLALDFQPDKDINGVVTSVLTLQEELARRGHEIRILTLGSVGSKWGENGIYRLPSINASFVSPGVRFRPTAASQAKLKELLEWGPDIVHANTETSTYPTATKISKRLNIPLVVTAHTCWQDLISYLHLPKVIEQRYLRFRLNSMYSKCDALIAPSKKQCDILQGYNHTCPIEIIPTGIDTSRFAPTISDAGKNTLRMKLGLPTNAVLGLYVGRIAPEKSCDLLLRYASKAELPHTALAFVGDGPKLEELKKEALRLGLSDKVFFTGAVPHENAADYYAIADFFMSASRTETQGLTYIEAQASGLPLLCRADACLDRIVRQGENGYVFHNEEEFLQGFEALVASRPSREEVRASFNPSFTKEHFAESVEDLYIRVIEAKRKKSPF